MKPFKAMLLAGLATATATSPVLGSKQVVGAGTGSGDITVSLTDIKDSANANVSLSQNDFIIVTMGTTNNSFTDYTYPAISGWTLRADRVVGGTVCANNLGIYHKFMGSSPDGSIAVPQPPAGWDYVIIVMAFRGINTSTPFDVADATGTGGGNPDPPSITPVTAGAIIVFAGSYTVRSLNSPTPWLQPADLSSTVNDWNVGSVDSGPGQVAAMGVKKNWTSGAFDMAALTGGHTHSSTIGLTHMMVLRPA